MGDVQTVDAGVVRLRIHPRRITMRLAEP